MKTTVKYPPLLIWCLCVYQLILYRRKTLKLATEDMNSSGNCLLMWEVASFSHKLTYNLVLDGFRDLKLGWNHLNQVIWWGTLALQSYPGTTIIKNFTSPGRSHDICSRTTIKVQTFYCKTTKNPLDSSVRPHEQNTEGAAESKESNRALNYQTEPADPLFHLAQGNFFFKLR